MNTAFLMSLLQEVFMHLVSFVSEDLLSMLDLGPMYSGPRKTLSWQSQELLVDLCIQYLLSLKDQVSGSI